MLATKVQPRPTVVARTPPSLPPLPPRAPLGPAPAVDRFEASPETAPAPGGLLARWARREVDAVAARVSAAHGLDPGERRALVRALREVERAKLKEYWRERGPAETKATIGRVAIVAALTLAAGLASPAAVLFAALSTAVTGVAGRLAVLYKRLGHAAEGRAALELAKSAALRGEPPARRGLFGRIADRLAGRTLARYSAKLDPSERAVLARKVDDMKIAKTRELGEMRLPVELGAIAATGAAGVGLGLALGLTSGAGAAFVGVSALLNALIAVGLTHAKLAASLEGAAHAAIEELAKAAPPGSELERLAAADGVRERHAIERARAIAARYAVEHRLAPDEHDALLGRLAGVAQAKHKDVWERRVAPTLLAPLARGGASLGLAEAVGFFEPAVTGVLLGVGVEAAVSAVLLYKKLDHALEGAAAAWLAARDEPLA